MPEIQPCASPLPVRGLRYNENIYFEQGSTLWINLYLPSEMTWDATGMTIRQEGNFLWPDFVRGPIGQILQIEPISDIETLWRR
jgi:DUF1680 family protein